VMRTMEENLLPLGLGPDPWFTIERSWVDASQARIEVHGDDAVLRGVLPDIMEARYPDDPSLSRRIALRPQHTEGTTPDPSLEREYISCSSTPTLSHLIGAAIAHRVRVPGRWGGSWPWRPSWLR
jgi:hypothetical protein